jgi:hypothetical protein
VINRTQALVLGFFALAWAILVILRLAAPVIYDQAMKLPAGDNGTADTAFLIAISLFIGVLAVGVVRRWRWMFWLILVAFLFGILRVPASILELTGVLPLVGPAWYAILQAGIGVVQFAIGLAMLAGYRRRGTWGAF